MKDKLFIATKSKFNQKCDLLTCPKHIKFHIRLRSRVRELHGDNFASEEAYHNDVLN